MYSAVNFKLPKLVVKQPTTEKPRVTSPTDTMQLPPIGKSSSLVEQYSARKAKAIPFRGNCQPYDDVTAGTTFTYAAAPRIMSRIKSCKPFVIGHHDSYMEQYHLECERRGKSSNIRLLPDLAIKHQSKRDKAGPISTPAVKFYFDATDSFFASSNTNPFNEKHSNVTKKSLMNKKTSTTNVSDKSSRPTTCRSSFRKILPASSNTNPLNEKHSNATKKSLMNKKTSTTNVSDKSSRPTTCRSSSVRKILPASSYTNPLNEKHSNVTKKSLMNKKTSTTNVSDKSSRPKTCRSSFRKILRDPLNITTPSKKKPASKIPVCNKANYCLLPGDKKRKQQTNGKITGSKIPVRSKKHHNCEKMQTPANKILASKIPVRCKEYDYLLLGQKKKQKMDSCNSHGMIHIPASKIPVRSKKHHCEKMQTPSRKIPVRSKEYNFLLAGQKKNQKSDSCNPHGKIHVQVHVPASKISVGNKEQQCLPVNSQRAKTGRFRKYPENAMIDINENYMITKQSILRPSMKRCCYNQSSVCISEVKMDKVIVNDEDSKSEQLFVKKPQVSYKTNEEFSYSDVSGSEDDDALKQKVVKLKGQEYGTIRKEKRNDSRNKRPKTTKRSRVPQ